MTKCDICKGHVPPSDKQQVESRGHVAFKVWCPACGIFAATKPAIALLDRASRKGNLTRNEIVAHFRWFIESEKSAGRLALIMDDHVQAYCYGTKPDIPSPAPRQGA